MQRDNLRDIDYYNDRVNFRVKVIEKKIQKVQPDSQFEAEVKMKGSFRLVSDSLYLLHQKYSRGDDLSEFKPLLLNMLT
ncbi:PoNe immunity protein domain-containing protein, partial [Pseudoalteromonas sp. A757]